MKKNPLRKLVVMLCAVLLVVTQFERSALGFTYFKLPDGRPYVWNLANLSDGVIYWNIENSAPPILRESLQAVTAQWTEATEGRLRFAEGLGGIAVYWDDTGEKSFDSMYLAYTYFATDLNKNIISGNVVVNAKDFTWQRGGYGGVGPTVGIKRSANLDSVMLHELGHALGLDHSDRDAALIVGKTSWNDLPTMNSVIYAGAETLHVDDVAGIRTLYPGSAGVEPPESDLYVSASPSVGRAPLRVSFSQTGGDKNANWDFGDGTNQVGANISHRFTAPGFYTVKVSSNGKTGSVVVEVQKRKKKRARRASPDIVGYLENYGFIPHMRENDE